MAAFVALVHEYREKLVERPYHEVFQDFFERVGIKAEIEKAEKVDQIREMKVNNFLEFINTLYLYSERREQTNGSASLSDFLEYVSLFTDTDDMEQNSGKISLLTVHSAKGLEFDYVAIVGLTDGQFPNHRAVQDDSLEEERRLFYVAITRARKMLSLSMPRTRMQYGEWLYNEPSRFIYEIDPKLMENPPGGEEDEEAKAFQAESARSDFFSRYKDL